MPEALSQARAAGFEKDWDASMTAAKRCVGDTSSFAEHLLEVRGAKLWTHLMAATAPGSNWKLKKVFGDAVDFQKIMQESIERSRNRAAASVADRSGAASVADQGGASASVADQSGAASVPDQGGAASVPDHLPLAEQASPMAAVRTPTQTYQDVREGFNLQSDNAELNDAIRQLDSRGGTMAAALPDTANVPLPLTAAVSAAVPFLDLSAKMKPLRAFTDWRVYTVMVPFVQWVEKALEHNPPLSVGFFGSSTYSLALPSSDFDVVVVLQAGRNGKETLHHLYEKAKADSRFTRVSPAHTSTLQIKFRAVWVDCKTVKVSRSADSACFSTDMCKLMMDQRAKKEGFVLGVLSFKLLAHHLNFLHKHMKTKGALFKAIALSFWAIAVFDALPQGAAGSAADRFGFDEAADSAAAETLLHRLISAFKEFDWKKLQVFVARDGTTRITEKTMTADVVVFLEATDQNSAANVTHEHVRTCVDSLAELNLAEALDNAIYEQDTDRKRALTNEHSDDAVQPSDQAATASAADLGAAASAADLGAAASAAAAVPESSSSVSPGIEQQCEKNEKDGVHTCQSDADADVDDDRVVS